MADIKMENNNNNDNDSNDNANNNTDNTSNNTNDNDFQDKRGVGAHAACGLNRAASGLLTIVRNTRGLDCCIDCYNNNQTGLLVVVLLLFQWLFVIVPFLIL